MGVANGRGYQEVGVASGWNLWVCISSFFGSILPIALFIFKCFFVLVYVIFVQCYN